MVNDETVYWQAGYSAGQAARRHDAGLARHQREWKCRAVALEKGDDKKTAEEAYKSGYAEGGRA